ncbi:hypothetical protein L7F22_051485 [Adiantum nelumboides]|nr:hypothetical protein [Adiantum nelumboides]
MADSDYCPECKETHSNFQHDMNTGDLICKECACVLEARMVDPTAEWRSFEGQESKVRVGEADDPFASLWESRAEAQQLQTYIQMTPGAPAAARRRTQQLQRTQYQAALVDASVSVQEKHMRAARRRVRDTLDRLPDSLPPSLAEDVLYIFSITAQNFTHYSASSTKRDLMLAACFQIAAGNRDVDQLQVNVAVGFLQGSFQATAVQEVRILKRRILLKLQELEISEHHHADKQLQQLVAKSVKDEDDDAHSNAVSDEVDVTARPADGNHLAANGHGTGRTSVLSAPTWNASHERELRRKCWVLGMDQEAKQAAVEIVAELDHQNLKIKRGRPSYVAAAVYMVACIMCHESAITLAQVAQISCRPLLKREHKRPVSILRGNTLCIGVLAGGLLLGVKMADSDYCPECKETHSNFQHDMNTGDLICKECACVLEARMVDPTAEWRSFEGQESKVRVGEADDPFASLWESRAEAQQLQTYIQMTPGAPAAARRRTQQLQRTQYQAALVDASVSVQEKHMRAARRRVRDTLDRLPDSLPPSLAEDVLYIFSITAQNFTHYSASSTKRDLMLAACFQIAAGNRDVDQLQVNVAVGFLQGSFQATAVQEVRILKRRILLKLQELEISEHHHADKQLQQLVAKSVKNEDDDAHSNAVSDEVDVTARPADGNHLAANGHGTGRTAVLSATTWNASHERELRRDGPGGQASCGGDSSRARPSELEDKEGQALIRGSCRLHGGLHYVP